MKFHVPAFRLCILFDDFFFVDVAVYCTFPECDLNNVNECNQLAEGKKKNSRNRDAMTIVRVTYSVYLSQAQTCTFNLLFGGNTQRMYVNRMSL